MMSKSTDHEKTLRIVRYFLPRLGREEMAKEIEQEKQKLKDASRSRISELRGQSDARITNETKQLREQLNSYKEKAGTFVALSILGGIAIVPGVLLGAAVHPPVLGALSVLAACGLAIWAIVNWWQNSTSANSTRQEISHVESRIRQEIDSQISAENAALNQRLALLDARLGELIRCYSESIASELEVMEFCNARLHELRQLVASGIGIESEDILDERSAEIWAPSFLQSHPLPEPVLQDAIQSEHEIGKWADDIISPMRQTLSDGHQWEAFRRRILPMLGFAAQCFGSESANGDSGVESCGLNALRAVRFSSQRQMYLAGHYFYQKIICAEDLIGIFRAYVNILNRRVPNTSTLQLLYSDVAAIGIETSYTRERFDISEMTVDQHTYTLALELSSGSIYRMSGDAGSAGQTISKEDAAVQKFVSQANEAFRDQIVNVRALIRDAKATRNGIRLSDTHG